MKLKDINEIKEDGLVVFMPSGIQATLFNEGKKILVKYYNLKEDRYTIKDFKKVMAEGIEVFSDQPTIPQQSVLMESEEPELSQFLFTYRVTDLNEVTVCDPNGVEYELSVDTENRETIHDDLEVQMDLEIAPLLCDEEVEITGTEIVGFKYNEDEKRGEFEFNIFYEPIDFEDDMDESVLMESYGWSIPELELGDSGFDSPEEAYQNAKICLEDNNYEVGDFDGEGCSVYDPGDEEMGFLPFDGYCVIESDEDDDIDWEDEDDMDESVLDMLHKKGYIRDSLMEAYEKVKNPEGQVFKALKDKKKEYITADYKKELLTCLDRIARDYPNVKVRQQALTFMDEINLQEYWDIKAVKDFCKKHLEVLDQHVNESLNEDYKYSNEYVDNILSFSDKEELINSEKDFEDFLCYKEGKGYCILSITFEYEEPQINFQTEWFETKEEALDSYKKDFLDESLNEDYSKLQNDKSLDKYRKILNDSKFIDDFVFQDTKKVLVKFHNVVPKDRKQVIKLDDNFKINLKKIYDKCRKEKVDESLNEDNNTYQVLVGICGDEESMQVVSIEDSEEDAIERAKYEYSHSDLDEDTCVEVVWVENGETIWNINKNCEEKLNESMEDIVTVVDIPLVTEKLYNKLVNLLYGNKKDKNRDYEQQGNVLNFLQKIEDRIPLGCEFHTDLEDYGFTEDEINAIKKIVRDERIDESLNEELDWDVIFDKHDKAMAMPINNINDVIDFLDLHFGTIKTKLQFLNQKNIKAKQNDDSSIIVYMDNTSYKINFYIDSILGTASVKNYEQLDVNESLNEDENEDDEICKIVVFGALPTIKEKVIKPHNFINNYEIYTGKKRAYDGVLLYIPEDEAAGFEQFLQENNFKYADKDELDESLNEDENSVAEEIRRGNKSGQDPKFGNWLLETSLDEKWEQLTNDMKLYLMDGIADFVQQGSLKEQDLLLEIDPMTGLTKEDVQSLEMFDQEEIDYTFSSEDLQLNAYISYEVKTDLDTPKDMEESVNEDIKIGDICKCSNIFVKVDQIKGNTALVKPIHQEDIDAGRFEKREIVLLSELQKEDFYNESVNEGIYLKKENGEEVGPFENQEAEERYIKDQKDNGNKEEYEEIIKEENMSKKNEDCYKVYNTIDPDSQPLSFNSWNEVEDHLNKEWGDYKVSMAKENAEFGTDEDRDNFMGNFEIAIEPIEIPVEEIPAEGIELEAEPVIEPEEEVCPDCEETEVCPECGKEPCECETEEPIDDLEEDFEDEHIGKSEEEPIEEPEQEESEEETEEEINTPEEAADKVDEIDDALDSLEDFLNTLIGDEELTDEEKAEIDALETKEPAKEVEEKNEEFSDNMGMLTDINDLDFPDALANTVETKEDGSLYRLGDLAKEIEEVKSSMEEFKNSFKSELATMLQDLKNDLKLSVNNVETKVQDTKSAVDNLTSEEEDLADIEFDQEEAPVEEQGEEAPEEGQEEPSQEESEEEFEESLKGNRVYECIKAVIKNNKHPKGMISIPTIAEKLREDYGIDTNTRTKFGQQTYNQVANIVSHTSLKENVVDVVTEERERKRAMLGEAANWLGGGLMSKLEQQSEQAKWENLEKVKQEIDQAVQKGADAEQLKDQITLSSEDENEEKQAKDYAVQKLQQKNMTTESLLAALKNTANTSTLRNIRFQ